MEKALLRFFQQAKDLITDNRPMRMRLAHPDKLLEDVLLPQQLHGSESMCGGIEYRILCVSLDAFLPLKEFIALPVAVDIVTDRGDLRSICGIVTEAYAGDSDGGLAGYQLVMRDALSIMEKRINTRIFRNMNELEIVQEILCEWRTRDPIIGTCISIETDVLLTHPPLPQREFTMQHNESDADFIRRLLRRSGIAWYFHPKGGKHPQHALFLFNHPHALQQGDATVVRYHGDNASEERDSITSWCAARTLQPGRAEIFSWDYRRPWTAPDMRYSAPSKSDQGANGNDLASNLDDYRLLPPHAGDSYDDLCRLGDLAMRRHDYLTKCFQGEGTVRDLCVGERFELEGHPEIDVHCPKEREFVVTSLQLEISNNFSPEVTDRAQRLFLQSRWMKAPTRPPEKSGSRARIHFTAVRRGIPIAPSIDPRCELPPTPMQSAIVVGPPGEEIYCDKIGRVKIRFPCTRVTDHEHAGGSGAANTDRDSAWVRVASSWAGNWAGQAGQCGTLTLPRVGSEVLVAFLGGDPDKPIIVGQLYNQRGQPPAFNNMDDLPSSRFVSGIKSREVKSGRSNQLRFDDTEGEISAQLASEHAASQLNLGFITGPRENGNGKFRGEGAELRTEGHIALRASKGALLSAWPKQGGSILARDEMARLLSDCSDLGKAIGELAEKCRALSIERTAIDQLMQSVKNWEDDGNAAGIGVTSPAGISLSTPEVIVSYAGKDIENAAQSDFSATAGRRACLNAGKGLSLFAQSEGITAIAQNGKVLVQSQAESTEVNAATELMLTASEGKVIAMGKEVVLVADDGSFIKIGGGITLGTNATISHYGASFPFKGPKTMSAQLPKFEGGKTALKFKGQYYADRGEDSVAASGATMEIESTDGTRRSETSDAMGHSTDLESDIMHNALARVMNGEPKQGE